MENALDELACILRATPAALRGRWEVIALKLLGNLATGLAIGVGIAVGHAIAG